MNNEMIHNAQEAKISERVNEAYERGIAEERGRCAKIADNYKAIEGVIVFGADEIAKCIRSGIEPTD